MARVCQSAVRCSLKECGHHGSHEENSGCHAVCVLSGHTCMEESGAGAIHRVQSIETAMQMYLNNQREKIVEQVKKEDGSGLDVQFFTSLARLLRIIPILIMALWEGIHYGTIQFAKTLLLGLQKDRAEFVLKRKGVNIGTEQARCEEEEFQSRHERRVGNQKWRSRSRIQRSKEPSSGSTRKRGTDSSKSRVARRFSFIIPGSRGNEVAVP